MNKFGLTLHGCDDSTHIIVELTDEQEAFLRGIMLEVNKRVGQDTCKPGMQLQHWADVEPYQEKFYLEDNA